MSGWRARAGRALVAAVLLAGLGGALACNGGNKGAAAGGGGGGGAVTVEEVASGLVSPLFAAGLPYDGRLFIVERAGRIRILEMVKNGAAVPGVINAMPFLDIRVKVGATSGERGLLGLAFHPNHALNGLFYVLYTNTVGDSVLAEYQLGPDPNVASAGSELILMTVGQPFNNHNGGTIAFHPMDEYLYVGLGDGGSGNDPQERAQNPQQLLGKMLRLDVDADDFPGDPDRNYGIPADNPFAGVNDPMDDVLDEVWALGLRNPYRFSFDYQTSDLWIGDVGEGSREEVDYEPDGSPGGLNWGWDVREGTDPAPPVDNAPPPWWHGPPATSFMDPMLFDEPIHDYDHTGGKCSITGGVVYRGPEAPLDGEYFFGDFCSGEAWSIDRSTIPITVTDRTSLLGPAAGVGADIVAFGEDGFHAMYVVDLAGSVFRVGDTGDECTNGVDDDGDGAIDLADPGCRDADDPSEFDSDTACDDGYDNDADGDIDFADDVGCASITDDDEA